MATTKMWAVRSRLDHLVNYVSNTEKTINPEFEDLQSVIEYAGADYKTEKRFYVTGINCQPEAAYNSMNIALKMSGKKIKVLAYHGYQSFSENEVNADDAHKIGVKLARELWGERFQVVVATHLNTKCYHNHFVLCSTSFRDGKRFHSCKQSYAKMREVSDRLCREYELSVIEKSGRGKTKHYAEWQAEKDGRLTWRGILKAEIDEAISQSMTEYHFVTNMKRRGYEVKVGKHIAVRPPGKERFIRLQTNFGESYSREGIMRQMRGRRPTFPKPEPKRQVVAMKLKGKMKNAKKLTGFRALYFHYLYLMGKVPKKRQRPVTTVHFLFREDLLKIDRISNELMLLCRNRIDTSEQLFSYKSELVMRMETLTAERSELRKQSRRVINEPYKTELKAKIAMLTKGLGDARKEVGLCDDIYNRTMQIKEKRRIVSHDNNLERKEKTRNEPFR